MKQYAVNVSYVFPGTFFITAHNKKEAQEYVENQCGLVMGGKIHTTLPDDVVGWDFPIHPEKVIGRILFKREKEQKE